LLLEMSLVLKRVGSWWLWVKERDLTVVCVYVPNNSLEYPGILLSLHGVKGDTFPEDSIVWLQDFNAHVQQQWNLKGCHKEKQFVRSEPESEYSIWKGTGCVFFIIFILYISKNKISFKKLIKKTSIKICSRQMHQSASKFNTFWYCSYFCWDGKKGT